MIIDEVKENFEIIFSKAKNIHPRLLHPKNHQGLQKDIYWNIVNAITGFLINFINAVLISRLLGIDIIGDYTFAMTIAGIFGTIASFGGNILQITDFSDKNLNTHYLVSKIFSSSIAVILAIGFSLWSHFDSTTFWLILIYTLSSCFASFLGILQGILVRNHKLFLIIQGSIVDKIGGFIIQTLVVVIFRNIALAALIQLFWMIIFSFFWYFKRAMQFEQFNFKNNFHRGELLNFWQVIKNSTLLYLIGVVTSIANSIPRYGIEQYHKDQQGYFGIIWLPGGILGNLYTTLFSPFIIPLRDLIGHKKYPEFTKMMLKLGLIVCGMGIFFLPITFFILPPVMSWLYDVDLMNYRLDLVIALYITIIMLLLGLLEEGLMVLRKFGPTFIQALVSLVVLGGLSYLLIPPFGLLGALITQTIEITGLLIWRTFYLIYLIRKNMRELATQQE